MKHEQGWSELIRSLYGRWRFPTPLIIFDVGANIGQSASRYISMWPESKIYCFEPVSTTFETLCSNILASEKVMPFKLAFSDSNGRANMSASPNSTMNSLNSSRGGVESVEVRRGDHFCQEHRIPRINYLKIDAEGHDLAALVGFSSLLSEHSVDFIEVEAGMSWLNKRHVPLERYKGYLEPFGYRLLAIYEQTTQTGVPMLRRANLVFISDKMIQDFSVKNVASQS